MLICFLNETSFSAAKKPAQKTYEREMKIIESIQSNLKLHLEEILRDKKASNQLEKFSVIVAISSIAYEAIVRATFDICKNDFQSIQGKVCKSRLLKRLGAV